MPPLSRDIQAVLLDIEGTTTPISFVYEVLFPFAADRLEETCARAVNDAALASAIETLRAEHAAEAVPVPEFGNGAPYARHLMEQDKKSTGLKALQGLIWEHGYRSGELRGQVFDDVPDALRRWKKEGMRLRIFSSGSVLAQKLLFGHSVHGDLTPFFDGYHDTTTGNKTQSESYGALACAFDLEADRVLFLSDVPAELDAAASAGMQTGLVERPGNRPIGTTRHVAYRSFSEL